LPRINSAPGSGTSAVQIPSSSTSSATPKTSSAFNTRTSVHHNQSGPVAGGVVGGVLVLLILIALFTWYRRRRQVAKHVSGLITEPFMLEVPASAQPPHVPDTSKGIPYIDTRSRRPTDLPSNSEDSRSITAIKRQMQLMVQEEENSRRRADLEARTRDSSQWVSRAEHEAELERLRAEFEWLRDTQRSDWAMGLSDEMPPAYQRNSAMNSY
jgi:hypothetical protein